MPVLKGIGFLAVCAPGGPQSQLHEIRDAALAWREGRIAWVGREADLPASFRGDEQVDAGGQMVVPGLIDCHTHLAFGGWRASEFELRVRGTSYQEIARAGGGIQKTVEQTRRASFDQLCSKAAGTLSQMVRLGITAVEAKSGYGLDVEHEIRLLRVYQALAARQPVRLIPTLLGAHVVPKEFRDDPSRYVEIVCEEMIPAAAAEGLAEFCDVFVEEGAFGVEDARRILEKGSLHGLRPKLHADQLHDGGGAQLAAEVGAVSADHLEYVSDEGITEMARAGVVAVSLPLASLYLSQGPLPARRLIEAGVAVAVSTDFNPGSAPSYHLPLAMMLACNLSGMAPYEVLKGCTVIAARAVGLESVAGSLEVGKSADLAVIDAPDPNHWMYHFRANACTRTFIRGEEVYASSERLPC